MSAEELALYYQDCKHILDNTRRLISRCSIHFDFSPNRPHQNKLMYSDNREEDEKTWHVRFPDYH